jgi:glycosyltransferase involved in cell wall biosynthesis
VHVLYLIDSLVAGGAERSLVALVPSLAELGVYLDVAFLKERPGLQPDLEASGVSLFNLDGLGGRVGWYRRSRRLLASRRPDLVHTTLFEADVIGRVAGSLSGIPVVSSLVNVPYGQEHLADPGLRTWKVRAAQLIDALTARRVTRFHAITAYVASVMSRRLRIPPDRIDVVHRGRDPQILGLRTSERRFGTRRELGLGDRHKLVLAAARHEHQKGLDVLLDAFPTVVERLPETRLLIAGREGNKTTLLRSRIAELRLEDTVRLLGQRDDVLDLQCAADVFVLPSRWEGLGSVLLEAMALEAPIVASDLPAIREVTGPKEVAYLVPAGSATDLAFGIMEALNNPVESGNRARAARERFLSRFTIERIAQQMVAFYERAISSRGGP